MRGEHREKGEYILGHLTLQSTQKQFFKCDVKMLGGNVTGNAGNGEAIVFTDVRMG